MKRSTLLAIVGGLCLGCAGVWLARDPIGELWWSWQAERPVSLDWAGADCADPGTATVLRAVVQLDDLGCSPDIWLPWLEDDLARTGARSWADSLRTGPQATPKAQFRLALALSRSVDSPEPELALWMQHAEVPASERAWARRWLGQLPTLPGWADPQVQHGIVVQRFLDADLPTAAWRDALRVSRVAPGAVPADLLRPAVDRTVVLLTSADPVDAPLRCEAIDDGCWLALIEATNRVLLADADGVDGAGRPVPPDTPARATLVDSMVRALYGAGDPRIESTRQWVHALGQWASEAPPEVVSRGLWIDARQPSDSAVAAQVVGERGGGPWTRALIARAVDESRGVSHTVTVLADGSVRVSSLDRPLSRCGSSAQDGEGTAVSDAQIVARASVEALEFALHTQQDDAARRLAGLAERLDPERFAGLSAAVRGSTSASDALTLGARMGRTQESAEVFTAWVAAWRSDDAEPCDLQVPNQPG